VSRKFSPSNHKFQFDSPVHQIDSFFRHIEADYLDGKPRHIADPETSSFDIISIVDFEALSTRQIQDRLRHKNIVITGCNHPSMKFDEAGLRTLSPLHRKISIQGTNESPNTRLISLTSSYM
jgi:hypothetical protein